MNHSPISPAQEQTSAALIKKSTSAAHLSTERSLIKYVQAVSNNAQYAQLLACMHGWFAPLEATLDQHLKDVLPDYSLRRKTANMLHDLQLLNAPVSPLSATETVPVSDPVEALGCFYVMEGSTLGGRIIKKLISEKNPSIPAEAFSFFSGYGEDNMKMWQLFIAAFNENITTEEDLTKATAAANACFAGMEKWISDYYSSNRE